MKLPYIERIWRIRGSLPLEASPSPAEVFDKLDPLFQASGTTHSIAGDTLSFTKKNALAQDKMSVFDRGELTVGNSTLSYWMTSRALLFCFLAPLLFIGFAQLTLIVGEIQKPTPAEMKEAKEKAKKEEEKKANAPMHPIDKFLGAPAPDKPKKEDEKKKGKKKKEDEEDQGPSNTPAYVFAGIFFTLYLLGRWLEPWLIKREFRRRLTEEELPEAEMPLAK